MSTKKRGLGRGLDALLGSAPEGHQDGDALSEDARAALQAVSVDRLQPGPHQPRQYFDEEALQALAESIRSQGVIQPLLVRPAGGKRFEIIAGERRWRAAKLAGLPELPVIVREIDEQSAMAVALVENIQRADLNPLEEADAIHRLIEECGLTHAKAAEAVGRSRAAISNLLRLFDLPSEVQQMVRDGQLSFGHARALLQAPDAAQLGLAQRVAAQGLTVRQTEALARKAETPEAPAPARREAAPSYRWAESALSEGVGLPVRIKAKESGRGQVTIAFRDQSEFDALMALFAKNP
ncbi:ParB/RepB/Spo0J family partition protein [Algiphilus sp. NNCM1]|uniref:ParB/RepB/Spo0J family partition protein n=1 Tax=Algiphilus sp. TaxID=1872431 RepID=UPI001CA66A18|nr:ParB/RepB/Spo0J family partition protein [Algiphilus sp.]MBY8965635.1 ParB/RepB/Spo0J family partition protein [Algiphilus acroporae]MCI5062716.1 ParB/RepB/Spo0J family partition protein [Algiphilus sp.]MCI5103391.1 ParB/RepB/Spo0J family partition protein [Algiphilus sp.]